MGSPAEIQAFVFSGLNRFGCRVSENADGSWRLGITEPALQTASVGEVIARAVFDPEWALDDPDVTLLDVSHPLVRRLIEEVKQSTFRDAGYYGRTAYLVTPDVEEVTALFHLLSRYVVNTEPTAIIEELLPLAVPVYGTSPSGGDTLFSGKGPVALAGAATQWLPTVAPTAETRTELEVTESLQDALAINSLDRLFEAALQARRQELAAERRSMVMPFAQAQDRQMEGWEGAQTAEWLQGIDHLSPGGSDLLSITLLYPG